MRLKTNLDAVDFRMTAAADRCIVLDSDRAFVLPSHQCRAIWTQETVEESQGGAACEVGSREGSPTTGPVSQWWESTCLPTNQLSDPSERIEDIRRGHEGHDYGAAKIVAR
ncbi:MAG: hypothetical protein ACYDC5_02250 [Candidatus Dormibacteria bacterium]